MRIRIGLAPVIAALALTAPGSADVLKTRDGRSFEGSFRGASEHEIQFEVGGAVRSFRVKEVAAVGFSSGAEAAGPGSEPAAESPGAASPAAAQSATASAVAQPAAVEGTPAAPPAALALSVPAGTRLRARLADSLDPRRSAVGDRFAALLDAPIEVEGVRVVPQHTQLYGRVAEVQSGGPAGPALALELTELLVRGESLKILTGSQQIAATAGPPAAAAGPAAQAAETGAGGRIPGGSILEFRLLQPLELRRR